MDQGGYLRAKSLPRCGVYALWCLRLSKARQAPSTASTLCTLFFVCCGWLDDALQFFFSIRTANFWEIGVLMQIFPQMFPLFLSCDHSQLKLNPHLRTNPQGFHGVCPGKHSNGTATIYIVICWVIFSLLQGSDMLQGICTIERDNFSFAIFASGNKAPVAPTPVDRGTKRLP